MSVEPMSDQGQTLAYPSGKVVGVVDTQDQFDEVVAALKRAGFDGIRALHGADGLQLLERVNSFFFNDYEERALQRHIHELQQGHLVFSVQTSASRAEEAANVASEHGARFLVHFGFWTLTWLKQ